jgi:dihydrofolate reductase
MGTVIAQAMMSLDGYIAKDDNTIGRLFDWLQNGEVELNSPRGDMTLHVTPQSAEYTRSWIASFGVLVCGRTLFDVTDGWDGRHDFDVPVVVVTHSVPAAWVEAHPDAPFTFVTDGVEAAIARAQQIAGDLAVNVTAGVVAGQCLELGLLDEVAIDLVPVVMGGGRPFFGNADVDDVAPTTTHAASTAHRVGTSSATSTHEPPGDVRTGRSRRQSWPRLCGRSSCRDLEGDDSRRTAVAAGGAVRLRRGTGMVREPCRPRRWRDGRGGSRGTCRRCRRARHRSRSRVAGCVSPGHAG